MVWKSNLADTEQEVIEDLGGVSQIGSAPVKATGGIASNRQTKTNPAQNQSRYQQKFANMGATQTSQAHYQSSQQADVTSRSNHTVLVPPTNDANKLDQVTGNSEELAQNLEKMVSQLDIITRTAHVLEQRISMNEESVANVLDYFKEIKQQYQQIRQDKGQEQSLAANQNLVNYAVQN